MVGLRAALMVIALGCAASANSASQVTVTIAGTVMASPPCVINSDRLITAPFGDVKIDEIDGSYKTITIPYSLDCARARTNEVRMRIRGNASYQPYLLAVPGNPDLGIALKKDGVDLALENWADFDTNKTPLLQAVLVKKRLDSEIQTGAFSANATLVVEYR